MRKNPWFFIAGFFLSIVLSCPFSFAGDDTPTKPAAAYSQASDASVEWVKQATQKFSPVSWELLMQYENLPPELESSRKGGWSVSMKKPTETFQELRGGKSKIELLDQMATNLHVIVLSLQRLHAFRYTREKKILMDWENAEVYFFLPPDKSFYISFPIKSLYPSRDLMADIPESRRTSLCSPYLVLCRNAQRFGVIGLLEEFHAFYFEAKFYVDMQDAFGLAGPSQADGFLEWVRHSQNALFAFYEFDFFILEYLLHLKEGHPANYEALKSCQPFVQAYGEIRAAYADLVRGYQKQIQSRIQFLNESGHRAEY